MNISCLVGFHAILTAAVRYSSVVVHGSPRGKISELFRLCMNEDTLTPEFRTQISTINPCSVCCGLWDSGGFGFGFTIREGFIGLRGTTWYDMRQLARCLFSS
ncbi:hypothetical protein F5880DRAFT_380126 [Lentinula raphanica]|nr:hypothetical protein F5880DRAFT_380126 [Lentinula raphanica]